MGGSAVRMGPSHEVIEEWLLEQPELGAAEQAYDEALAACRTARSEAALVVAQGKAREAEDHRQAIRDRLTKQFRARWFGEEEEDE